MSHYRSIFSLSPRPHSPLPSLALSSTRGPARPGCPRSLLQACLSIGVSGSTAYMLLMAGLCNKPNRHLDSWLRGVRLRADPAYILHRHACSLRCAASTSCCCEGACGARRLLRREQTSDPGDHILDGAAAAAGTLGDWSDAGGCASCTYASHPINALYLLPSTSYFFIVSQQRPESGP